MKQSNWRIAVSGYGVYNPIASNIHKFKSALIEGKQQLSKLVDMPIPRKKNLFGFITDIACPDIDRGFWLASQCIDQILNIYKINNKPKRIGLFLATMSNDTQLIERDYHILTTTHGNLPEPLHHTIKHYPIGSTLHRLGQKYDCYGPRLAVSNACASGNIACNIAYDALMRGDCDLAFVVGIETFKLSALWGAERAGFIGTHLSPFAQDRDGAILGEGAAALLLQRADETQDPRQYYGYISGHGCVCDKDAAAITLSDDGSGLINSMKLALAEAALKPETIGYINAHAPGTIMIDKIECQAIKDVFNEHSKHIYINSTKSITSHLAGAAAITEIIASLIQLQENFIHPNAHLTNIDPTLAVTPQKNNTIKTKNITSCISNACGGGGLNTSIVLQKISSTTRSPKSKNNTNHNERYIITGASAIRDCFIKQLASPTTCITENTPLQIENYYPVELNYQDCNTAAQLGAVCGYLALEKAHLLSQSFYPSNRIGIIAGTTLGGSVESLEVICDKLSVHPKSIKPSDILTHGTHLAASFICRHFNFIGMTHTLTGLRAAGIQAIWSALLTLKYNRADAILALGYDTYTTKQQTFWNVVNKTPHQFGNYGGALLIEKESLGHLRGVEFFMRIGCCDSFSLKCSPTHIKQCFKKIFSNLSSMPQKIYIDHPYLKKISWCKKILSSLAGKKTQIICSSIFPSEGLSGSAMQFLFDAYLTQSNALLISLDSGGTCQYLELINPEDT